jgi:hypothetical protein
MQTAQENAGMLWKVERRFLPGLFLRFSLAALILILLLGGCNSLRSLFSERPAEQPSHLSGVLALCDTIVAGQTYFDIIRPFDQYGGRILGCKAVLDSAPQGCSIVNDTVVQWKPRIEDMGTHRLAFSVSYGDEAPIAVSSYISVIDPGGAAGCPTYAKLQGMYGDPSTLPDGYIAFDNNGKAVLRCPLRQYAPKVVAGTGKDWADYVQISDNGHWILYLNRVDNGEYLIRPNGRSRTRVPFKNLDPACVLTAGFYRSSPYGCEIFYVPSKSEMRAVHVDLGGETPVFGADRAICIFGDGRFEFWHMYRDMAVCGDQIFGRINPIINGTLLSRTGYVTIPGNGRGVAHSQDVYLFKDGDSTEVSGCGFTMSYDGLFAVCNAGPGIGTPACVPQIHEGFYVTSFRRKDFRPIEFFRAADGFSEHIERFGISINWCPPEYQTPLDGVHFLPYCFTNDNRYMTTMYWGPQRPCGVWLVDWQSNIWYPLSPRNEDHFQNRAGAFIGTLDPQDTAMSADTFVAPDTGVVNPPTNNPGYRVLSPNGGEVFGVGDTCTIQVTAQHPAEAKMLLSFQDGLVEIALPGLNHTIDPTKDTAVSFVIPDSANGFSLASSCVKVVLQDYNIASYRDESDSCFSIVNRPMQ